MLLLQAYQADLLADLNEGEGIGPDTVCDLRRATDLSLRATKEMARSISRSMAALVTMERHIWFNLSNIKGKDKNFLTDAPLSPSGLFGDAVNSVVERFQESAKQAAAFQKLLPRHKKMNNMFVCFGPPNKGSPASKQRMSKWLVEAISLAYESAGQPSPMAVRSHSTRSMVQGPDIRSCSPRGL